MGSWRRLFSPERSLLWTLMCAALTVGCSSQAAPPTGSDPGPDGPDLETPDPGPDPAPEDPDDGGEEVPEPVTDSPYGPIIDVRDLAAPPGPAQLVVMPGFQVSIFADSLSGPRHIARRGNEIWVAERGARQIRVLRDLTGDGYAEDRTVAWQDNTLLNGVASIDYYQGWFYCSTGSSVFRFRDDNLDRIADGTPAQIISGLPSNGHVTRTVRVNPTNKKLYVAVGSAGNLGIEPEPRATIREYSLNGSNGRTYASGLRNAVGIAFDAAGRMYANNNGWDNLGDFLPHECFWQIIDGGFYGWPYAYSDNGVVVPDPTFGPGCPQCVADTILADWEFGAHKAPLGMCFFQGKFWGPAYEGTCWNAFHGSWVPNTPVGYEVGYLTMDGAGEPTDFDIMVTNFRQGNNPAVGRPVDVIQFGNAILFSDDSGGRIYRIDKMF